jgi:hypothetical protein
LNQIANLGDSDDTTGSIVIIFLGVCLHGVDNSCFIANRNRKECESIDCRQGKRKKDGNAMTMIGHELLL